MWQIWSESCFVIDNNPQEEIVSMSKTFMICVCFLFVYGCDGKSSQSKLEWGHLNNIGQQNLILATPTDRIAICGINPEVTSWAVLSWANAIGRAAVMSRNLIPCGTGGATNTVTVEIANGGDAPAWTSGTDVTVNSAMVQTSPNQFYRAIMLHEVGHAWGLCDQYADMGNCDPNNSTQFDDSAVMGSTTEDKQQLTPDDVAGIKALSLRPDVSSSTMWQGAGGSIVNPTAGVSPGVLSQPVFPSGVGQGNYPGGVGAVSGNYPGGQTNVSQGPIGYPTTTFPMQYYQQADMAFIQLIALIMSTFPQK